MVPLLTGPQNQRSLIKMLAGLISVVAVSVISHQMSSKKQRKTHIVCMYMIFKIFYRQSIVQEGEVPTSHLAGN